MLSEEEKKEMIEDAASEVRRKHFRAVKRSADESSSLDEYLFFLQSIQEIFEPFAIPRQPTLTKLNKL